MAYIITVGGTKGGCGKSNFSVNCAAEFARRGHQVGILDADKKLSSANWGQTREEFINYLETGEFSEDNEFIDQELIDETFTKSQLEKLKKAGLKKVEHKQCLRDIKDTIKAMSGRNDIVIIDVGGGDTREFRQASGLADIIITPFKPSTFDVDTIPDLIDALELALDSRENLIIRPVVNEVPTGGNKARGRKLIKLLQDTEILNNPLKTEVKSRTAYVDTLDSGLGVVDYFDSKAKGEFSNIVEEIISTLNSIED